MQTHESQSPNTLEQENSLDTIHIDFMDIAHDLHQKQSESKKKDRAKRRSQARRAIEDHQEKKRLEAELKEWWDDL